MRIVAAILFIALASFAVACFLPWWMVAVVSLVVAYLMKLNPGKAFLAGFLGVAVMWCIVAVVADTANEHILSQRMAQLFSLLHYSLFIMVSSVIGGLVGGFAAAAGAAMRRALIRPG